MTCHCVRCGAEVEVDVTLSPVPDVVHCPSCQPVEQVVPQAPTLELLEVGKDGGVLGVNFTFDA
jgi:hypothetical protein